MLVEMISALQNTNAREAYEHSFPRRKPKDKEKLKREGGEEREKK